MKKMEKYIRWYLLKLVCHYFLLHIEALRKESKVPGYKVLFYRLMLHTKATIIEELFYPDWGGFGDDPRLGLIRLGAAKLKDLFDQHPDLISVDFARAILLALQDYYPYLTSMSIIGRREEIIKKLLSFIDSKTILNDIADGLLHTVQEARRYESGSAEYDLLEIASQVYRQTCNMKGIEVCADIKMDYFRDAYPDAIHQIMDLYYEAKCWKKIHAFVEEIQSWGQEEDYGQVCRYWTELAKHVEYWDEFYIKQSQDSYQKELGMIGTLIPPKNIMVTADEDDLPF